MEFTKILEFDSPNIVFHVPKRNPLVWKAHVDESYEEYYFFDESDEKRAFQHVIECYKGALAESYEAINYTVAKPDFMKGKLVELSQTPDLLYNLITISEHITYDKAQETILFDLKVTAEELMGIDAVLREPILLIEQKSIKEMKFLAPENYQEWINRMQ